MTSFFVGGEIHSLDPTHLVEEGLLGGGQCGTEASDYASVGASPGIDVLSVHDYYGTVPVGGDTSNGLSLRFAQAALLDKPIITGEVGILAGDVPGCDNFAARKVAMAAKLRDQFALGRAPSWFGTGSPGPWGPAATTPVQAIRSWAYSPPRHPGRDLTAIAGSVPNSTVRGTVVGGQPHFLSMFLRCRRGLTGPNP